MIGLKKDAWIARMCLKSLRNIEFGSLALVTPKGNSFSFKGEKPGPDAQIRLHDWSVVRKALTRGDTGFGEEYVAGNWDSDDVIALMHFFCLNEPSLQRFFYGKGIGRYVQKLVDFMRQNTPKNSKKNIRAHYDVGNDFYKLWLDETMTYSSALYNGVESGLADAQRAKYGRMLDKLGEKPGKILEIGCGWGGFAEEALKRQHTLTGLTLSHEQYDYATKRLANQPADIVLRDYRHEKEMFDYIVSIEMFEAVGERYWPTYFSTVKNRMKKGGKAMVQTITIADESFQTYRKTSDFIRQYTFPGGMLPSVEVFNKEAKKAGLKCKEVFAFGQDYAKTLAEWLKTFDASVMRFKEMGYNEEFIRSWRYYMAACAGSFAAGRTNVVQIELEHA